MAQNIILCDDHALLRNGIKNWIETHSTYKITREIGTWAECKKLAVILKKIHDMPGGSTYADKFLETGYYSYYYWSSSQNFYNQYIAWNVHIEAPSWNPDDHSGKFSPNRVCCIAVF